MYIYKIQYYDSDIEEIAEETGIVDGANFYSAAKNVSDCYGDDNIVQLIITDTVNSVLLPSDLESLLKGDYCE